LSSSRGDWCRRTVPYCTGTSSRPATTRVPLISILNPGSRVGVGTGVLVGLGAGVGSGVKVGVGAGVLNVVGVGLKIKVDRGVGVSTTMTGPGVGLRVGPGVTSLVEEGVALLPLSASKVACEAGSGVCSSALMVDPGTIIGLGATSDSPEPQAKKASKADAAAMPTQIFRPVNLLISDCKGKRGRVILNNRARLTPVHTDGLNSKEVSSAFIGITT